MALDLDPSDATEASGTGSTADFVAVVAETAAADALIGAGETGTAVEIAAAAADSWCRADSQNQTPPEVCRRASDEWLVASRLCVLATLGATADFLRARASPYNWLGGTVSYSTALSAAETDYCRGATACSPCPGPSGAGGAGESGRESWPSHNLT